MNTDAATTRKPPLKTPTRVSARTADAARTGASRRPPPPPPPPPPPQPPQPHPLRQRAPDYLAERAREKGHRDEGGAQVLIHEVLQVGWKEGDRAAVDDAAEDEGGVHQQQRDEEAARGLWLRLARLGRHEFGRNPPTGGGGAPHAGELAPGAPPG